MAQKTFNIKISEDELQSNLGLDELLFLKILESLDKGQGCFASNTFLAKLCKLTTATVSRKISRLKKYGYISVSYDRKHLAIVRRTIKVIKKTEYSLDSEVNGVINYVDQMFKHQSDFIPLENKDNIRENIAKKLKEFGSQQELVNYLQKNKAEFASTDGVNLWLKGELDITPKEHQATTLQETSQDKPQESNPLLVDDSVQPDTTPKLTQEERMKIFRGEDVEPKQNKEASNTSEGPINQETSRSDNYLLNNAYSYFNDLLKEDQKSYDDNI
ncbi:helix-turn-helix domain-containing protein [Lactobacillus gasseri]|nr:helix-turn-helix domain-containing protein [Lactobacillus gasseri]MCZ3948645.1 helix-turn-helix domain-containing protein [Lactobacillus gasseri]QTH66836.1 helix-turn-helix domain-containing protein [Lactobacillus gasseri]